MTDNITVLGVGNILYQDDGVGIRVVEALSQGYDFSDNVSIVDGGVLGINLLGIISQAGRLIVVDTVINHGRPGPSAPAWGSITWTGASAAACVYLSVLWKP
ncbi:hydrogenase maturation protease [Desulfotignum balticum]|uniref:hydrogenase maturation protease n=1 Tax=Desulfotignum balticum TaxID=115781 RepID=UPI000462D767|nr:hydrogenase maturation protease [Desulfotignum balticum]